MVSPQPVKRNAAPPREDRKCWFLLTAAAPAQENTQSSTCKVAGRVSSNPRAIKDRQGTLEYSEDSTVSISWSLNTAERLNETSSVKA